MNVIQHDTKNTQQKNVETSTAQLSYKYFQLSVRAGICLLVGLAFIYLICLNSIATRGFALEQIKEDRLAIMKDLEQIEIDLAIPLSLYALQSSSQIQDMELIAEKQYLHVKNGQLAFHDK